MKASRYWIEKLELLSHPEGGYFKEVYRSTEDIQHDTLPTRFSGNRSFSTSIYFLLNKGQKSAFHRIKSDELWHFYDGEPATIYVIDDVGKLIEHKLGLCPEENIFPQVVIPANCWFAAEPKGKYTLSGCTVSPGFDFTDFEMADSKNLIKQFPQHEKLIRKFT